MWRIPRQSKNSFAKKGHEVDIRENIIRNISEITATNSDLRKYERQPASEPVQLAPGKRQVNMQWLLYCAVHNIA